MKAKKKRGGTDSARLNGLVGFLVTLEPAERDLLHQAAAVSPDGHATAFARRVLVQASRQAVEDFRKKPPTST